jgi:hypothetical protein
MSALQAERRHANYSKMTDITIKAIDLAILTVGRLQRLGTLLTDDDEINAVVR